MDLAAVAALTEAQGLACRGGFHPVSADGVPDLPDGMAAATLVLLGFVGGGGFPGFAASAEAADGGGDALDRWSRRAVGAVATALGGHALFPFGGPPYLPFQRWAQRAERVFPSPLGILIHPDWGLWHSYRGAVALPLRLALPPADKRPSPCETCAQKPCLTACPVVAFTPAGYDVPACAGHIAAPEGGDCMAQGCRARRACPIGAEYRYGAAQAGFYMSAFRASVTRK